MSEERPHAITPPEPQPVTNLADPRAIQILSTEHWSLLATRSLVYNEAFTRGGMFLSFLSMSFVALALLAQAMAFGDQFLAVAAILLAFDLVIGLTTYGRIMGANEDDLRTVHGMARIRHGYTEIAPAVTRYITTPIHDDVDALMMVYGSPSSSGLGVILYGLTTSGGMIGLITSMVGGVLTGVLGLMFGAAGAAVWIGVGGAALVFGMLVLLTTGRVARTQAAMPALFPSPETSSASEMQR
ncbi:MAG: hypothetical protein LC798_21755 [Chloroflexi bacterium]|nr:hypothetical protein [Chloroflexota bacterium]